MIVTRDISVESGRTKTIREIQRSLAETCEVTTLRLPSFFETHRAFDVAGAIWEWFKSVLSGQPLPLQCALYASPAQRRLLVNLISKGEFQAVYLDMVRCQLLLRSLRRALPHIRVVTDFDDLISRRMDALVKLNQPFSPGVVGEFIPIFMRHLIEGPLSRLITRYEAATVGQAEYEMLMASEAVVLVSSDERGGFLHTENRIHAAVHVIPPPVEIKTFESAMPTTYRFVFVGSDRLLQNRLSIDYLLAMWRRLGPKTNLHIFGQQERRLPKIAGVCWRGYVPDIAEAYKPGSILLVPAFVPGGVKTKVTEGWSYGCPVLGNASAFEGIDIEGYPLKTCEDHWAPFIVAPAAHTELFVSAAKLGNAFVHKTLGRDCYARAWQEIMFPSPGQRMRDTQPDIRAK